MEKRKDTCDTTMKESEKRFFSKGEVVVTNIPEYKDMFKQLGYREIEPNVLLNDESLI